jgi:TolB-like protein/DNA-binding SARP family transcriptional activator/Tfp pilus assembly protein PilF
LSERIVYRLRLFGGASIDGPDGPLTGRAVQRRRLALLALLAVARERGLTRDRLVSYLWPDADPERARHLLSDSVYRINQALGGDALLAAGDHLRINPERLPSDAWEFRDALESQDWKRAVDLHAALFLDGFFLPDSGEFDRWASAETERFRRERARALEALARDAEARSDEPGAVRWWRMLAADDPHSSRVALELMRALDRAGDRPAALQYAHIHTTLVRDDLEVDPDPEVLALARRLQAAGPAELPGSRPPAEGARPEAATAQAETPEAGAPEPAGDAPPPPGRPRPARSGRPRVRGAGVAALLVAAALALGLWAWRSGAPGAPDEPTSIAVLPFQDLSPDGDQEYFADGITEELLLRLSRVDGLDVVGRTSSFAFKRQEVDVAEVARRLGVQVVLGGSVLKAGNRLRVFAQLIDATSGYQLWSERYEREQQDVFEIQDEIASAIVTRLRGRLERPVIPLHASTPTDDPEAYNLYLRGRFEWHKRSEQGLRQAAEYFRRATERAPDYARAWAGLGDAYAVLGFYDHLSPGEAFPRAIDAAHRALDIDPTLSEPHATLGYAALYYEWDWERAEAEFRRTLELDPGYSTGHQWYSNFLTAMGRFDEAVREMRTAQDLDPLSLIANAALGWVLFYATEYERAIDQFERTLDLDPDFEVAILWRSLALGQLGRTDEALAGARRAVEVSRGSAIALAALARVHALAGDGAGAGALVREFETRDGEGAYVPAYEIAAVHEARGDAAAALDWLERARGERSHSMVFLSVDPRLASLRGNPAFEELVRRVGLDRRPAGPGS